MGTKDKKYIIAGGYNKLYILDAEDGNLKHTQHYSANGGVFVEQMAVVRPNILVTVDRFTASLHDIRNIQDIQNIPSSIKLLPNVGAEYVSVIALESNPGDFAIGGKASSTNLGSVYIYHLEYDQTKTTLKYVDDIQGIGCRIFVIKELKRGTIIFGGDNLCTKMCLWNYADSPRQDSCWDDQAGSTIFNIVGVQY